MSKKATIDHIEIPKMSLDREAANSLETVTKDSSKRTESYNLTYKEIEKIQKKRWEEIICTIDTETDSKISKKEFIQSLVSFT
jgi:hypothetical protein